jgi:hypothetical protein
MNEINSFRGSNKIIQAYENNQLGCTLEPSPNNPFRLHRFKKKYNVEVTGKEVDGSYVIVFWDKLKQQV